MTRSTIPAAVWLGILLMVQGCDSGVSTEAEIASVSIEVGISQMARGISKTLALNLSASDGSSVDPAGLPVVWTTSDPLIVGVDQAGRVSAVAKGSTTVTATVSGIAGSAKLTVVDVAGTWTTTVPDPQAPGGINQLSYELEQNGTAVSGTYSNSSGFPPFSSSRTGRISGRLAITNTTVSFEHSVQVSGPPCNISWDSTMRLTSRGDGSMTLTPTQDPVPLMSQNCSGGGSIRVAEVDFAG